MLKRQYRWLIISLNVCHTNNNPRIIEIVLRICERITVHSERRLRHRKWTCTSYSDIFSSRQLISSKQLNMSVASTTNQMIECWWGFLHPFLDVTYP
ncbi:LOW QUALITY PROTEIN: hypothetical protein KUTeg_005418 [Tegillarca granosa]|uniref:Uncharacterized protein n=1 Tax=Tegillarca granosa TaxID=220873 RepID=A0ABQ9FJQ0_TEGGR|nr:LOW QUALITY PROTEIN: hypothetical protein KUTeg_005418 [Tegillarca granosa]